MLARDQLRIVQYVGRVLDLRKKRRELTFHLSIHSVSSPFPYPRNGCEAILVLLRDVQQPGGRTTARPSTGRGDSNTTTALRRARRAVPVQRVIVPRRGMILQRRKVRDLERTFVRLFRAGVLLLPVVGPRRDQQIPVRYLLPDLAAPLDPEQPERIERCIVDGG